ncbi:prepilin peptidase CpaA [Limimonas halophila]|uniref:Prepilin peptidase CpaA n=1 Tax=Limimonas halophila TaxID=1082479 RepID=A0A1G7PD59_9PROT|nr:prepilin peptidase [Limimonas halophila]SDF83420.1 prepilin peptidase CpaA [Limimonas halophila]
MPVHPLAIGLACAVAALVGVAAVHDATARRVPNAVCLLLIAIYPAIFATPAAPQPIWGGLAAALAVFAVGAVVFAAGWLGGGDVKLLSVLALWAGAAHVAELLLITALAGGVLALAVLVYSRAVAVVPALAIGSRVPKQATLPYGVAIACGGLWIAATLIGAA